MGFNSWTYKYMGMIVRFGTPSVGENPVKSISVQQCFADHVSPIADDT